jgi:hypothetical protein
MSSIANFGQIDDPKVRAAFGAPGRARQRSLPTLLSVAALSVAFAPG